MRGSGLSLRLHWKPTHFALVPADEEEALHHSCGQSVQWQQSTGDMCA